MNFVRYFWDVLEPGTKLVEGWTMEAICLHLEHLTLGNIPNNRLLINVPPGFSKAIDVDEPVLTTWGWKRHGDLRPGDFVYGPDGQPKRVLANTEPKIEPAYEVEFDDGTVVVAGAGHLWDVERDYPSVAPKFSRGRKRKVVATPDLIQSTPGDRAQRPDRIPLCAPVNCAPKTLMVDPYLLGAWLGDGASGSGVIYSGDQDVANFAALGYIAKTYAVVEGGSRKQDFHRIGVDDLQVKLRVMGLLNNKHIPQDYLDASIEQRWELLRGLMDTDGCATATGHCSFVNKNKLLSDGVAQLAASLGMKPHISERASRLNGKLYGTHWMVVFTAPTDAKVFRLERKQSRLKGNFNARSRNRYVQEVRDAGQRMVSCIQVEGELYLVGKRFVTTHNSLITNVFWPAWVWGPMNQPTKRFIAFSYASHLTVRDNRKFLMLLQSQKYQAMYGDRFSLVQQGAIEVSTDKLGKKFATSVGGVSTGERGDYVILDDPHNVAEGESEAVRTGTVTFFRESLSNRLNSLDDSCVVVIMQRVHEADVSGEIISQNLGYDHLMIPMEYEPSRHCVTSTGWEDPRTDDGELAWPERFTHTNLRQFKTLPYMWSGQYQQAPAPRGGGILKEEWWRPFLADKEVHGNDGRMPVCDYVVVSLDPAYTEKKENDPSGCVVLGVWYQDNDPNARFVVMDAWSKHLEIQGAADLVKRKPSEKLGDWTMRTRQHWGLVEWVAYTCERFRGASRDGNLKLLIEGKASGISVEQLMRKAYAGKGWSIKMCDPKGADKIARVYAIQDMFAEGMVYVPVYANAKDGHGNPYLDPHAPLQHRDWCSDLIWECSSFPKGVHDDRVDALSQALRHIRTIGMAVRRDEAELMKQELMQHRGKSAPALYEG